ncbi:MAG: type II toxin-antitoxin system VapB family antitoxin [Nitrococcus sp.]|nr:type II toxin-antitoxin system VapB family antitoxin [Nitrococcus sp.]
MRTNIEIDDEILGKAMKLVKARTKREAVNIALQELVASRERRRILEMFGSDVIDPSYDYKAARASRAR